MRGYSIGLNTNARDRRVRMIKPRRWLVGGILCHRLITAGLTCSNHDAVAMEGRVPK